MARQTGLSSDRARRARSAQREQAPKRSGAGDEIGEGVPVQGGEEGVAGLLKDAGQAARRGEHAGVTTALEALRERERLEGTDDRPERPAARRGVEPQAAATSPHRVHDAQPHEILRHLRQVMRGHTEPLGRLGHGHRIGVVVVDGEHHEHTQGELGAVGERHGGAPQGLRAAVVKTGIENTCIRGTRKA